MPSPFPGMDPYLESPTIWPDVHHNLISATRAVLNPTLLPRYVGRIDIRAYISDENDPGQAAIIPGGGRLLDEEINEAFIKILEVKTSRVVTIIELLNPATKIHGSRGRDSFMSKRQETMNSETHWVEIDLLRDGIPTVTDPLFPPGEYRVLVSSSKKRPQTHCWPFNVRQPFPLIPIPLRGRDPEALLDLGAALHMAYENGAYDLSVDYRKPPQLPLEGDDAEWARELLRGKK